MDDYEQVRQIVSGYCHVVDQAMQAGKTPDVSHLFHPDAVFTNSFQRERWVGRQAIVDWYHKYLGKREGHFRYTRHKIYEPYIEIVDGVATSTCHFDADSLDFTGIVRTMAGRYDDTLEPYEGKWLLKSRHIDIHYIPAPVQAQPFRGWR
ncbi:nuclear transport factor 2 family protein [Sciscionella marina]|uniref:nuclear transport factor 2 family protein n=1 Tax=Sciscionella marina TaxID=508770 RepID=UPI00036CC3E7|nr:nuclear transport factor 2 family protein [Sciscionella marina]